MKNFKEEIEAMKAQIAALENNLTCGCDECECEEQSVGQDIGCGDQVILARGEVIEEPYVKTISGNYMNVGAETVVFTREELITFAAKLMERTVTACKEAISDTEFEADYICSLELNYNNQIEVEIDNSTIRGAVCDEIDNTIELDNDSVEVEVDNILRDMLNEKQS
jgi:hypothetical protein